MKRKHYFILSALFVVTLGGCSKSSDNVTPAIDASLLPRKWSFPEINVKTDAKSYTIPSTQGGMVSVLSDDNVINFNKGGTFSYVSDGKPATGKWTLTDRSLVLIDADNLTSNWTVNNLTSTDLELGSINVNITKGQDLTDRKIYTEEEQYIGATSLIMLLSLDKRNGGTVDFTKEPQPKTLQLVLKGKGQ